MATDTEMHPPPFPTQDEDTAPGSLRSPTAPGSSHLNGLVFSELVLHLKGIREGYAVTNSLCSDTNTKVQEILNEIRGLFKRVGELETRAAEQDNELKRQAEVLDGLIRRAG